jgi:predicted nuclease with TOPRIM domain
MTPTELAKLTINAIEQIKTKLEILALADTSGVTAENLSFYGINDLVQDAKIYSKRFVDQVESLEDEVSDLEEEKEELEDKVRDLENEKEDLEDELVDAQVCDCVDQPTFIVVDNLADTMKMEFIASVFNEFTLEQLEERLKI